MNMSYLLAGTASTNPIMFALAMGVIMAWKVAGYYGVDRYLLPAAGHAVGAEHQAGRGERRGLRPGRQGA